VSDVLDQSWGASAAMELGIRIASFLDAAKPYSFLGE
jgi:hypothetical protein